MSEGVRIRVLTEADWELLRDMRLLALRTDPGSFARSYDESAGRTEEQWRSWCREGESVTFGLFAGEWMIGMTGVSPYDGDPDGKTAMLVASFIHPDFRGRRLSEMLYGARLDWIRRHPKYARVVVSHRLSNAPSASAILRHGFVEIDRAPRAWPDGGIEDEVLYEMRGT